MKTVTILVPQGTTIFETNGVNGITPADTEIVFEVHEADLLALDTEDPSDVVAQGLAAAGRTDLLALLKHEGDITLPADEVIDETVTKGIICYTPTGRRVEQTHEDAKAAAEFADEPDIDHIEGGLPSESTIAQQAELAKPAGRMLGAGGATPKAAPAKGKGSSKK